MQATEQIPDHLPAIAPPQSPDFNAGWYAASRNRPLSICASADWQAGWYAYGAEQLTAEQLAEGSETERRA